MVRNRIKRRLDESNTLNTIPYQDEKPELIQLNKALSKADTRHDIPVHLSPGFFTTTLNGVYGGRIDIIAGPPVVSYIDDPPSNDIFTNAIKSQVSSYNLNSVNFNFNFEGNPYVYTFDSLSGPMPKHSSIPYFMQRLETGIELLQGDTKIVVVSDNASANAVHRTIKKQSEIFLRNANPPPAGAPITEAVTLASIIDMAGKSVPPNWAELFHAWWDDCVGEEFDTFNIDLTAIGAVNMGNTGLQIHRTATRLGVQGDKGSLVVGIVIGRTTVNILYDLNQRSLEQSIVRDTRGTVGGYIFVSGKNIAKVFFEEYNKVLNGGTDRGAQTRLQQQFLNRVITTVSDATRTPVDDATTHVINIFHTLGNDYDLIGKYFIVGKLIGDLLCPLCCDDKWYTITNDNLMIARCLLLSKRALFSKHSNQFSGFYFFVPQEQPATVQRAAVRVQREAELRVAELQGVVTRARAQAQALQAEAQAAETQAQAQALHAQAQAAETQAQAQALHAQAQAAETQARAAETQARAAETQARAAEAETERVRTRSQTAAEAVTRRNQELGIRIEEDGGILRKIIDKRIEEINAEVDREEIRSISDKDIYIKHKLYCKSKIESIFYKFLNDEITIKQAIHDINKINKSTGTNVRDVSLKNRAHLIFLRGIRFNSSGEMIGGTETSITITVKWKKEIFNISIDLSAVVSDLKVQLFSLTGVAPEKQKVIMGGKTLKDEMSLESSGVKQDSVLQMMGNASETWVKPDITEVKFVDDLSTSEQATDICGGYANVVIQVFKSYMINKIEEILKGNNGKRNFIFGIGNQTIAGLPLNAKKFIESLKSFLEKVISKIKSKDNLFILQIFGDVISHLEDILSITIPIIFQPNDNIVIPFCIDYDKVSHVCVLLGINIEDFKIKDEIKDESFENQFNNFKELFPNVPERILPTADIPTIVRNLVTSILNKTIPTEALPDIYGLLKGDNLETILSSNKDNINNLYFNVIPEVLGIMHSYGVFTEAEEVEFYIIQAIIGNENPNQASNQASNEHAIITKSIYSLYQNITVLYGIYVYDAEILKTFIENIKLKNNMIQYDGGFNSLQTIMDYRCGVEFETMVKDTTTYVSLNQFMQQQEQKIKELEQSDKTMLDTERLHALSLNEINERDQLKFAQTAASKGGKNNRISNPKHNTKYRKNYKKFVSKYIINKKKNKKNNKNNNKNNKKNNKKNKKNNKNKTKKNKRLTKSKPNSKRNNKTLKNKKGKSKSKSNNHKSKYNKKTKTNYYNYYRHNKTLKH